jgi:ketosteroid isomerase-like protein
MGKDADVTAIGALLEQWSRALHDHAEGAAAGICTSDILMFSLAPPLLRRGAGDLAQDLRDWFATWNGPIEESLHGLEIHAAGDVAYATGLARMRGMKRDGEGVDLWFRETIGFRRTTEGWRIAHRHSSVPFLMDGSLRAAVALQP